MTEWLRIRGRRVGVGYRQGEPYDWVDWFVAAQIVAMVVLIVCSVIGAVR